MAHVVRYDLTAPTVADGFVRVERMYCLDVEGLDRSALDDLLRIYRALPGGFAGDDAFGSWFGADEQLPPFLTATMESPGVLVFGCLGPDDWRTWEAAFRAALERSGLPFRDLDDE